MNRYVFGAILAGLVLLTLSGLGGIAGIFAGDRPDEETPTSHDNTLGTLPIEQAGRIVQRQVPTAAATTQATGTTVTGPTTEPMGTGATIPGGVPNVTISPPANNVIPRPTGAQPFATSGDISPIQPDLVRPETLPAQTDPNLDSIPALW